MNSVFAKLKQRLLYHFIYKEYTNQTFKTLLTKNLFILENDFLTHYYHVLEKMLYMNKINLELLMGEFQKLEDEELFFNEEDLGIEVMCVVDNIVIERRALKNYFELVNRYKKGVLETDYIDSFKSKNAVYLKDMQYNAEEFISLYESESYSLEQNVKK